MSLRDYLHRLESQKRLSKIASPISTDYEIAGVLKKLEPTPVLFEHGSGAPFRIVGNLFCSKAAFADYFGIQAQEIIPFMMEAIDRRTPCPVVEAAPCQEVVILEPRSAARPRGPRRRTARTTTSPCRATSSPAWPRTGSRPTRAIRRAGPPGC